MLSRSVTAIMVLSACVSAVGRAHAANSTSVLQFGGANFSSTVQVGTNPNAVTTLQFGRVNGASTVQVGSLSSATVNSSVIGQGGGSNSAMAAQIGGANSSFIGQIGSSNAAALYQAGLALNGSQIIQQVP